MSPISRFASNQKVSLLDGFERVFWNIPVTLRFCAAGLTLSESSGRRLFLTRFAIPLCATGRDPSSAGGRNAGQLTDQGWSRWPDGLGSGRRGRRSLSRRDR